MKNAVNPGIRLVSAHVFNDAPNVPATAIPPMDAIGNAIESPTRETPIVLEIAIVSPSFIIQAAIPSDMFCIPCTLSYSQLPILKLVIAVAIERLTATDKGTVFSPIPVEICVFISVFNAPATISLPP